MSARQTDVEAVGPGGGRFVAWSGFVFGSVMSIAANVLHTWIPRPPEGAPEGWAPPDGWVPSVASQIGAAVWPVSLLISVEVLSRVQWPDAWMWKLARYGGVGTVGVGSALISYGHLHGVLTAWGYGGLGAAVGPLVLDGLMVVSGFALLANGPDRTAAVPGQVPAVPDAWTGQEDRAIERATDWARTGHVDRATDWAGPVTGPDTGPVMDQATDRATDRATDQAPTGHVDRSGPDTEPDQVTGHVPAEVPAEVPAGDRSDLQEQEVPAGTEPVRATDENILAWLQDRAEKDRKVPGRKAVIDTWSIGTPRADRLRAQVTVPARIRRVK